MGHKSQAGTRNNLTFERQDSLRRSSGVRNVRLQLCHGSHRRAYFRNMMSRMKFCKDQVGGEPGHAVVDFMNSKFSSCGYQDTHQPRSKEKVRKWWPGELGCKEKKTKKRGVGTVMGRVFPVWGFPRVIGWSSRS